MARPKKHAAVAAAAGAAQRSTEDVVGRQRYVALVGSSGIKAKEPRMRVSPYYSINPSDPDVHHVHSDCPTGQQIPVANKRQGTNGYRLCEHCAGM